MIKRTLLLGSPMYVRTELEQLVIEREEGRASRPIEDLGYVIVEHPQVRFSTPALQQLAAANVVVVFCGRDFQPSAMLLPMDQHYKSGENTRAQVAASRPMQKQLWQQTVKAKLRNQASLLDANRGPGEALRRLATRVRSGDPDNLEGEGARRYWGHLFASEGLVDFTRAREGNMPNPLLNYGYAILRSAVSRAIVGAGLHPTFGMHHHNRYNAFCLADDLMEPYRPVVDGIVLRIMRERGFDREGLTVDDKRELLSVTQVEVTQRGQRGALMVAVQRTAWSLAACYLGERKQIEYCEIGGES